MDMPEFYNKLTNTIAKDFIAVFLGKKLGSGIARSVYTHRLDPKIVIKIEDQSDSFQNVIEARMWEEVQYYKPMAKWLAPVVSISPCGKILIQYRAQPLAVKDLPEMVPAFLQDIKRDNWGVFNGKPVCFDYGSINLTFGKKLKMKKVLWEGTE